jgi:predicted DNA-binding transcriptional regulator YafY
MLELLQSRGRLTGVELATRLEVDQRTVRRYVAMLQELGIPVASERGRYGGYQLRPGFKLPPLMLTDDEALAVTLGLLAGRRLGLGATALATEGALAKLERVLPLEIQARVRAVQDSLFFTQTPPRDARVEQPVLVAVCEAARQAQPVWLRYRAWRGEETERLFDPYGVVFHTGRWYAVGWDHLRDAVRVFRLDRVLAADPRDGTFVPPADFDSVAAVVSSLARVPYAWSVEVLLDLPLEEAQRRVPLGLATLEQTPRGVTLRTNAERLDGMARVLVSLGCSFVVRQPPELLDALRRLALEVSDLAIESEVSMMRAAARSAGAHVKAG